MDKSLRADSLSVKRLRLLVVDDHEVTRGLLKEVLEKAGYEVELAGSGEEAVKRLEQAVYPIVLSDIRMLELDGMAVLREVKRRSPESAVILMTGFGSMDGAIEAIRQGAFDYVSKPFRMDDLKALVFRAAKHWASIIEQQKGGVQAAPPARFDVPARALIGRSPRIVEVYKTVARAAMSPASVLILGERGTGKELVAKAIHENSSRRIHKFVAVSCGALSEAQQEAELFGAIEEADGGTLFLDEIAQLASGLQARLLRILQEQEFRPTGAYQGRKVDLRVIAATQHLDFDSWPRAGRFREDLYYRLKVIPLELPALRERLEDLPELVGHFLSFFAGKNQKVISHISDEALEMLGSYAWPGNVRELEHAIEHAVAMSNSKVLFPEDFPQEIRTASPFAGPRPERGAAPSLEEMEKLHILKVLQEVGYNKSRASEVLGIDRATLYRKAQRYGIDLRGK